MLGNNFSCIQFLQLFNFIFWYLVQEHVNEIDFDYMEYARQRFQQYWLRKPALLGSVGASPDSATDGNRAI